MTFIPKMALLAAVILDYDNATCGDPDPANLEIIDYIPYIRNVETVG